jgi:oxygen-independent coproporphyrinogen-3 oxidase
MREISLYVHVPFCKRRCSYCTFYHVPHLETYESVLVDALVREFGAAAKEIGEPFRCPTVFFGGGTPSVLNEQSLDRVFAAIEPYLPGNASCEVTFETNPEDVTPDLLTNLRARGANRLSLGIQSMGADGLRILKRCAPRTNAGAVEIVKEHFGNYSVDLLLGIPEGLPADLRLTLDHLDRWDPPHVSVYCLEAGGVMEADVKDFFAGVDAERAADEYLLVCEELARRGYVHYEVSNFAKPGYESRHNRCYWRGGEYVGIGPAAHSFIGGERFYNEASIERYVSAGIEFPADVRRIEPRGPSARRLEDLMLALRTSDGLPLDRLTCRGSAVEELVAGAFARVVEGRVILTDRGYLVLNEVLMRLAAC